MKAVGIILAGGNGEKLGGLTSNRATPAMPVGGCYRAIDFPLSNMSHSGIGKVAVITQYNSRSLHDHLSSPKWWDLGQKRGGLFVFTPYLSESNSLWYRGTADSLYQNISFLKRSNEPYVVIASGNAVYKMDYRDALDYHAAHESDITIVCRDMKGKDVHNYGVIELDESMRMIDFEEKPLEPASQIVSMGIYIIGRTLLIRLLETIVPEGRFDFVKDVIMRYRKQLKTYGFLYDGYWSNVSSVNTYFDTNMDFLDADVRKHLVGTYPYIKTKPKDEPPVKYNAGAYVSNSIVGGGCILNGFIENSVIFRKVFTGENTRITNSIVMEGCVIANNCELDNCILDKEVVLSDGKKISGTKGNPKILTKGTVV